MSVVAMPSRRYTRTRTEGAASSRSESEQARRRGERVGAYAVRSVDLVTLGPRPPQGHGRPLASRLLGKGPTLLGARKGTRSVDVLRIKQALRDPDRDDLVIEEPLEIRVKWPGGDKERPVAVTMRTPGNDFELAAGFLFSEGVIDARRQIREIAYCASEEEQHYNVVTATLRGVDNDLSKLDRNFYVSSSCGVCGKASIEAVEDLGCAVLSDGGERWSVTELLEAPDRLRAEQSLFSRTGGLHAAGVFGPGGEMHAVSEDIGRHNAVDKVVGKLLLDHEVPLRGRGLVTSGRASFEILQKAVRANLATVVAVGAPSSLAVDLATRFNVTLVGFVRGGGANLYSGADRVIS